jgi:hypothetical protein
VIAVVDFSTMNLINLFIKYLDVISIDF